MKKFLVLAISLAFLSVPVLAAPPGGHGGPGHGGHHGGPHGGPGIHHGRPHMGPPPMRGPRSVIRVGIGYRRPLPPPVIVPPVRFYRPYYYSPYYYGGYYSPYYYESPYYYDGINTAANVINAAAATATAIRVWSW